MIFELNSIQENIRKSVRKFVEKEFSKIVVLRKNQTGFGKSTGF